MTYINGTYRSFKADKKKEMKIQTSTATAMDRHHLNAKE